MKQKISWFAGISNFVLGIVAKFRSYYQANLT